MKNDSIMFRLHLIDFDETPLVTLKYTSKKECDFALNIQKTFDVDSSFIKDPLIHLQDGKIYKTEGASFRLREDNVDIMLDSITISVSKSIFLDEMSRLDETLTCYNGYTVEDEKKKIMVLDTQLESAREAIAKGPKIMGDILKEALNIIGEIYSMVEKSPQDEPSNFVVRNIVKCTYYPDREFVAWKVEGNKHDTVYITEIGILKGCRLLAEKL